MNKYRLTAFCCFFMVCITTGTSHAALTVMGDYVYDDSVGTFGQVWVRDMDAFTNMNAFQQAYFAGQTGTPSGMSIGDWRIASVSDFANLEAYSAEQVFNAFTGADPMQAYGPISVQLLSGRIIPDDPSIWGDYEFGVFRAEMTPPYGPNVDYDFVEKTDGKRIHFTFPEPDLDCASTSPTLGAWVVADVTVIPAPGAVWLLGTGLLCLHRFRRNR
jgi:hypothetical protein